MADNDQDKTEEPTAKKMAESLSKGIFPHSNEVNTTLILAATFSVIAFSGRDKILELSTFSRDIFGHIHDIRINQEGMVILISQWTILIMKVLAPLLAAVMVAAIFAGAMQTGFKLTTKLLEADGNKLNPVKGMTRIFNKQSLMQVAVDLIKISAMMGILWRLIENVMNDPIFSSPVPLDYIGDFLFRLFLEMLSRLLELMVAIAAIDYFWQRRKTHEDLKMSKQELKDEYRQSEGDPHVKGRQRSMAANILRQSIQKNVPHADVVVTNPTHYAVALRYEQGVDKAPVVVAKGEGATARHIKRIAAENGVPMVENKPVARLLYKTTKVGGTIPLELFQVVAQILAHVYRTHRYYFYRLKAQRLAARTPAAVNA
jgi:flagellar biosynthetic protein FlhB